LVYKDRATSSYTSGAGRCVVQIGLVPNTDWLKGVVELSKHGEIIVALRRFGAGRVCGDTRPPMPFQEIIIAAGDGAKAALNILIGCAPLIRLTTVTGVGRRVSAFSCESPLNRR
jgi:alkyl hydroperoxide reductase subunit F